MKVVGARSHAFAAQTKSVHEVKSCPTPLLRSRQRKALMSRVCFQSAVVIPRSTTMVPPRTKSGHEPKISPELKSCPTPLLGSRQPIDLMSSVCFNCAAGILRSTTMVIPAVAHYPLIKIPLAQRKSAVRPFLLQF